MIHSLKAVVIPTCVRNTNWEEQVPGVASELQSGWKLLNVHIQLLLV